MERTEERAPGYSNSTWSRLRLWFTHRKLNDRLETLAVVLLATASLATAWSGFQAAEWGGSQSMLYSQASSRRVQANEAATNAHLDIMSDIATFNSYAGAYAEGRPELMEFYEGQFSDRLEPAVAAWLATEPLTSEDAPNTPIDMPEYVVPNQLESDQLKAEADALFDEGVEAAKQSAAYVLNTLYLAAVLFFSGIANRVRQRTARMVMIGLGTVFLLYGLYHVAALPVQ